MTNKEKMNIAKDIKCFYCGSPVKFIPAGVSKRTGKPYDRFYSCTNKTCGRTMNPHMIESESSLNN